MPERYSPRPTLTPLLTVNEVAHVLKKSRAFVYLLVREDELHPFRIGKRLRFQAGDIEAYLARVAEADPPTAA